MPIYNGDIIDDYLRFRVDNRKFCWQKGAGRFETLPGIPLLLSIFFFVSLFVPPESLDSFRPSPRLSYLLPSPSAAIILRARTVGRV